jgi:hypothetical protein
MSRRIVATVALAITIVIGCASAAVAFFTVSATAGQLATSGTLGAPTVTSATASGSTSVTVSVSSGPTSPAATGYRVYPHGTTATPSCTIATTTGSCNVTGVTAGTTTSYDVYSTLSSWISSAASLVSATTTPAAPSAVTLVGGGTGGAYVDAANKSSLEIDVTLPATSTTSDSVHLTISDGTTTITPTVKTGTSGTGTVAFTAINLSTLNDGVLTITAWSSDSGGSSTSVTAAPKKDTASPAPTQTTPANHSYVSSTTPLISGAAGSQVSDAGHSADSTTVTVNIYAGATATGTVLQTLTGTVTSSTWSVTPTALAGTAQYTAQVTQTDAAGNSGTASTTFIVDNQAPTVTVTAPTAGTTTTTLTPTFTGTAGNQIGDTTHSADSTTVTVKVYAGTTATGTPVQTLTTTEASGAWSVVASGALTAGSQYTVQASQTDGVSNTGTSTAVTFTAGPLPPVALKFVNLSGGLLGGVLETGNIEMIDVNGNPVVNTTGSTITVHITGGLLGATGNVTIANGQTVSTQFSIVLGLGGVFTATTTAPVNGQTLTGHS